MLGEESLGSNGKVGVKDPFFAGLHTVNCLQRVRGAQKGIGRSVRRYRDVEYSWLRESVINFDFFC